MKFSDFIFPNAVVPQLKATDREGVIRELVMALVEGEGIAAEDAEEIIREVLKREELGSTGIGNEAAIPHAKHRNVTRPVGTVGISPKGIEFQSLDNKHVKLFFLLISPERQTRDHLRVLEYISQQLKKEPFCRFLKEAKTVEDVQQLLDEADADQAD